MIVEFHAKKDSSLPLWEIVAAYADELLDVYLRDTLERENRVIREAIVTKALTGPIDTGNFVTIDSDTKQSEKNEIDFDKDIDDILREIENDPDLQIDEGEIEKILKEIEAEAAQEIQKPQISINPDNISQIKANFKKNNN